VPDGAAELVSKGLAGPTMGGSVSDRGTILFTAVRGDPGLYMVSAAGKENKPVEVTGLSKGGFISARRRGFPVPLRIPL